MFLHTQGNGPKLCTSRNIFGIYWINFTVLTFKKIIFDALKSNDICCKVSETMFHLCGGLITTIEYDSNNKCQIWFVSSEGCKMFSYIVVE